MFLDLEWDGDGDPFPNAVVPPDADPASGDLIKIGINRAWLPFITGACTALVMEKTWDTGDDETLLERTQLQAMTVLQLLNTEFVDPPFYESDETADDIQLPDSPWYENIADWIITAFLALTFTPGTAIVYKTTIPRLRLAFRTGDLGALVRVLLDDLEIWTGDTSATGVGLLEQELDVETFVTENNLGAGPWTLRIEHDGPPGGVDYADPNYPKGKLEVELGDIRPRVDMIEFQQVGCELQVNIDNAGWTPIYDPTTCVDGLIDQGIEDAINDGIIQRAGGQPGASGAPDPGACDQFHVILAGNQQWKLPFPVSAGDSIEITGAFGGWADGSALWFCPNGAAYVLGVCNTGGEGHDSGDPLDTAYHMAVIGRHGTTYFDPQTSIYSVPDGIENEETIFQANDSPLADNTGQIEFDVEVCRGGWLHEFDLTVDQTHFVTAGTNVHASYNASGIHPTDFISGPGRYRQLDTYVNLDARTIYKVQILTTYTHGYGTNTLYYWLQDQVPSNFYELATLPANGENTFPIWSGSKTLSRLWLNINVSVSSLNQYSGELTVSKVLVWGYGTDPWA